MTITSFIDFFVPESYKDVPGKLGRARLFVSSSFLTSIFASAYLLLNIYFEFERGIYILLSGIIGFLLLPFLAKAKVPLIWLGNIFIAIGAFLIFMVTYYTGGAWSAIYPWIVAVPTLALLIVDKVSGFIWGIVSTVVLLMFAWLAYNGVELPVEYNLEMKTIWHLLMLPGLLLIMFLIAMEFKATQSRSMKALKVKNKLLEIQKETIQNQSNKLKNLIEEKDYIIQVLAHDLRNPLANIKNALGLLKTENNEERLKEYINIINTSSLNADNLVDRVLEMDALGHDVLKPQPEIVSACNILNEVIVYMTESAEQKKMAINLENNTKRCAVRADKTYLFQVFVNLISNAIKFSYINTHIKAVVSNTEEFVTIKIIDQGPGIKPEEEDKLFKSFAKLSARPTAGEDSKGLGLSLVKRYVGLSNGKVWHEKGEFGKGAVFVVELPLVD